MDLNEILSVGLKSEASDIHLKVGLPPIYRIDGTLRPLPKAPRVSPEQTEQITEDIMNDLQLHLRMRNIYIPWFHLAFISAAHTDADVDDLLRATAREQLEVLDVAGGEAVVGLPVLVLVAPGVGGLQDLFGDLGAGDAEAGQTKSAACVGCHGPDGNSPANPLWPKLAGQHAKYIEKQLLDFKSGARNDPTMLGMVAPLRDLAWASCTSVTLAPDRLAHSRLVMMMISSEASMAWCRF